MKSKLISLRDSFGLELSEQADSWLLRIDKPEGVWFDVTVPHAILEWFVVAHDESGVIWSEWVDYYPIDREENDRLLTGMGFDVERFVTILVTSKLRILHDQARAKRMIELKVDDAWKRADVSWMTAA